MKTRKFVQLNNLPDDRFFCEVSQGMKLILQNANELFKSSELLSAAKQERSAAILASIAKEEAAKYLMLLDAVRCPVDNSGKQCRARLLRNLGDHLARLVYADSCFWQPTTYEELKKHVDKATCEYYADGPGGGAGLWKCRNRLLELRESSIYCDYVELDENRFSWYRPGIAEQFRLVLAESQVLKLINACSRIGFDEVAVLKKIADIWRPYDAMQYGDWSECKKRNQETIKEVSKITRVTSTSDSNLVLQQWLYPMYQLSFGIINNETEVRKEIERDKRYPEAVTRGNSY